MRFGLMINSDEPAERDPLTRLHEHLERARAARAAGFHTLAAAHRYSFGPARPVAYAQSDDRHGMTVVLAAAACSERRRREVNP